tara:strand:- start:874 stop:1188 length:315 start_codon:yes stop_codon:yes gene_type:complete
MGIQIYIKTAKLKEADLVMIYSKESYVSPCRCGKNDYGVCHDCGTEPETHVQEYVDVEGIPFLMEVLDKDIIYHDANHWGSSRKPLLEFIEKHKLRAGEDWYEA